MYRREFLRAAGLAAGAATLGGRVLLGCDDSSDRSEDSILDHPAKEAPIDTIVVLMMENRSFDHFYGWLGSDENYLESGRRRYGSGFWVNGRVDARYRRAKGDTLVCTRPLVGQTMETNPWRGCDHLVPGHIQSSISGWFGRKQRARGTVADEADDTDDSLTRAAQAEGLL